MFETRMFGARALGARIAMAGWAASLGMAAYAQPGRGNTAPAPERPLSARESARVDITGYWVSVVTEDWRWRMVTPRKGDYASVPLNREGRRVADMWDPAKDEAAGLQCKSYGAAALMRVPGRLHITWQDDNTLKVETDAGTQTRLFHFGANSKAGGEPSWQGYSVASWEGSEGRGRAGAAREMRAGSLKVVTTNMRAGYLRKNGVPYSANANLTEFYDRTHEDNGDSWLIVTTIVDDPQYLQQPFITSTHFKLEKDGSKWHPTPCTSR
ncbi:MAG TPA: hypothetical protein VKV17_12700 [Bryobacteraceae bacterium]|nr:hypothetical protein [Bryobacteraceae bacterium]